VLQARRDIIKKDQKIFEEETNYRRNFVIRSLKEKIDTLKDKNPYKSFNKSQPL